MSSSRTAFIAALLVAMGLGAALRLAWLTADPPTAGTVGIVWHDEGAWVHNARNRALWGVWRTDEWNPMFIAPVFTALEFFAFSAAGVGTWQARLVPVASGLASIALLAAGLAACAGRRAALAGAALLATNYVFVMWNRAALMESTMTAFLVGAWAAYALARHRPAVGMLAGASAVCAFFSKAAAIFFVGAIALDAVVTLVLARAPAIRRRLGAPAADENVARAAWWTLAGAAAAAGLFAMLFVAPHWQEYRFYNWQMSVTRKPEYSLHALMVRASWLPIAHDFFTRMWLVTVCAALALAAIAARWRSAAPAERLLALWVLVGLLELVVHDSGNERRYVMFVPALVALAALLLAQRSPLFPDLRARAGWIALPLLLLLAYLVVGAIVRLAFLYEVGPGARLSAGLAAALVAFALWKWTGLVRWLAAQRVSTTGAALVVVLVVAGDLAQYLQWARARSTHNYEASRLVGRVLPPGTLVHGKLANGLSLENRIRPVFVGRGFGNYADRRQRDDVRYILTYIAPRIGYEGPVITDVLDAYPARAIVISFPVAETPYGFDRAALIDKFGARGATARGRTGRAHD